MSFSLKGIFKYLPLSELFTAPSSGIELIWITGIPGLLDILLSISIPSVPLSRFSSIKTRSGDSFFSFISASLREKASMVSP